MIYLDSNVFIFLNAYALEKEEYKRAVEKINSLIESKETFITSSLTWDEIVHFTKRQFGTERAVLEGDRFLKFPRLTIMPVSLETLKIARNLLSAGLKPRDAIHAACAIENNCKYVLTDDDKFDKIKELKRMKF